MIKICLKKFSNNHRQLQKTLDEFTQKIKQKQNVTDLKKIKEFVSSSLTNGKIGNLANKTARIDSKFDSFMSELKEKKAIPRTFDFEKKASFEHPDNIAKEINKYYYKR